MRDPNVGRIAFTAEALNLRLKPPTNGPSSTHGKVINYSRCISKHPSITALIAISIFGIVSRALGLAIDLLKHFAWKCLKLSPLRGLAKTLTSWLEAIVGMWRFSKSNGITEGFHTKMEMMSRRAYGFRNFENYRLRVLTHCGWNGIINRV